MKRLAVVETIWRTPLYRAATVCLFCAGLGVSATVPLFTLFFVEELGASLALASLYFVTALAGPVVSVITGRISDRLPNRQVLIHAAACWLAVGWLLMAVTHQIWMAFAISVVFISFMGTFSAQLFAVIRDEIVRTDFHQESQLVSTIRTAYALGWIIGPIVGSWLGLTVGFRQLFLGTAILYLVCQLPFLVVRRSREPIIAESDAHQRRGGASALPLFMFSGLCALAMSGDIMKLSFLPVYMEQDLAMPSWLSGAVISTQPFLELIMIPVAGIVAGRIGASRVLVFGVGIGVLGHLTFALSDAPWMLFVGQVFVAVLVSVILGLGVTVAQRLYPSGSGFASSVFFGALGISVTVGGLIGSAGVSQLGLPAIFAVPAGICALTLVGLVLLARQTEEERIVEAQVREGTSPHA